MEGSEGKMGKGEEGEGQEWEGAEAQSQSTMRRAIRPCKLHNQAQRHEVMLITSKGTYGLRLRWGWAGRARRVLATRKVHLHQHLQRLLFLL